MKSKLILMSVMIATSLFLLACSPGATKQASVEVTCDDFTNNKHVSQEVEVAVDGSLTVTLCSNPTTGFQWSESAEISDQAVLQQTDREFVPPKGTVPGAAGQEVWTLRALKQGTTELSMEYSQPWEGGEKAEWTFVLTVVVR